MNTSHTRTEETIAPAKKIIIAEPRGACAGVHRAIAMVEQALETHGAPVYVRKQIVHNHRVVASLAERGAIFVDSESEVPEGALCVFSAHGVSPAVRSGAAERGLRAIDATCPLVSRVHQHARRVTAQGRLLLLIGHIDHEEIEGVAGEAPASTIVVESIEDVDRLGLPAGTPVAYLTQTTLAVDETTEIVARLKERFSDIAAPKTDTICYASQNRQNGIKSLARRCDLVLVVGSENSSNSQRMVDVARDNGVKAHLVHDSSKLDARWLKQVQTIGVSSGASVPEFLVDELLEKLYEWGFTDLEIDKTATESVVFSVPSAIPMADRR